MIKEVIIIGLVILVVYLYYQQNNQALDSDSSVNEIKKLEQEIHHYQTLYQKRIEKDLGGEEQLSMKEQKISDLETQLLNLAKQKVKGKKEAEKILNELETNWIKKEIEWEGRRSLLWDQELNKSKEIITNLEQSVKYLKSELTAERRKSSDKSENIKNLIKLKDDSYVEVEDLKSQINQKNILIQQKEQKISEQQTEINQTVEKLTNVLKSLKDLSQENKTFLAEKEELTKNWAKAEAILKKYNLTYLLE